VCKDNELEERSKHLGLEVQEHIKLKPRQFLIPGFIDAHIHAPQYLYTGTGYDLELIEWLQRYTFPSESKYGNPAFCDQVYRKVVRRCLINGTTTACYHATIHVEATKQLSSIIACEKLCTTRPVSTCCNGNLNYLFQENMGKEHLWGRSTWTPTLLNIT
jgi:cytosine/adenosine deaminase-related metal-dependent hydrolase